jgi:hypothetical protein
MHSLHLRHGDLLFRILSPSPDHLKWIEEFFLPHFRLGAPSAQAVEVRLEIDSGRHRILSGRLGGGEEIPSFVLDSDVVRLPAVPSSDAHFTVYDSHYRAFFRTSGDRRRSTVLIAEDSVNVRAALMRVIREYVMNHTQKRGSFFLHASCFLAGGRPIIITGPKMAGKTTLLYFACLHGKAVYLANDRVLVSSSGDRFLLSGMPAIINVRKPMTSFFPEMEREILEEELHFRLSSGEKPRNVHPPPRLGMGKRYALTPLQFCRLAGTAQAREARDPIVVLPRITGKPGTFSLERIPPGRAVDLLEGSIFGVRHWVTSTPVFNLSPEVAGPSKSALLRKCGRFAAGGDFFLCEVGTDLYSDGENAEAMIGSILAGAPPPGS